MVNMRQSLAEGALGESEGQGKHASKSEQGEHGGSEGQGKHASKSGRGGAGGI